MDRLIIVALALPLALRTADFGPQIETSDRSARRGLRSAMGVTSPNGLLRFELTRNTDGRLHYGVRMGRLAVIEPSPLGIVVDGRNLAAGVEIGKTETYSVDEQYAWHGVHATAVNRCHGAGIVLTHTATHIAWTLDARACEDGIAFRYVVPGDERRRTPDEATSFRFPAGTTVWYHDFEGHYEGVHTRRDVADVPAGDWAAPPLTVKLPSNAGYASVTEAALIGYSGMALRADGRRGFNARLGHEAPVSYPYRLRYPAAEAQRLSHAASIAGTITSPWRVVIAGPTLNALVNNDIVHNLAPPPDPSAFPQGSKTPWIRPGRAVWRFLDGGDNTIDGLKRFSELASRLGFEHHVVEGVWQKWTDDQLRDFVDHAKRQQVAIWLWKDSRAIVDPMARRAFFEKCRAVGAVGAKIDFLDHEAKDVIDHYQTILREAAEYRLMVDFHGANKPTGEARTWPNELTREGIYGLEHRNMPEWARHNTTLPFTRYLVGAGDYTPVVFGERRKETSWAHQIATAAIFTSPLLVIGAHPRSLLDSPAVELIKSLPSVWDETIVLPTSEIGEIVAFARRRGDAWFVAVLNGPAVRTLHVDLGFLGARRFDALLIRDKADDSAAVQVESTTMTRRTSLAIDLRAAGGFVGRFVPSTREKP